MNPVFSNSIEEWYRLNGRDLPWRHTQDPYAVWVSEIILQQTRVAQGMDYFNRFLSRFPTVEELAAANEEEVLLMWQGLGYYSRARNLHKAARQIVAMGGFPKTFEEVMKLSGVGEYTAAAICSICFGLPCAVLDGNVFRVLSRYFGIDAPIDTPHGKRTFRSMADEMLDTLQPALYNQAIMDFGAMVCTPKSPQCADCPLVETCVAFACGNVTLLPVKARKTKVRNRYLTYLLLTDEKDRIYLQRRGEGDIWQGLYEPFCHESDAPLTAAEATTLMPELQPMKSVCGLTHQLTHQLLHADAYLMRVGGSVPLLPGVWVERKRLQDYAMPRLVLLLIEKIMPL
ncbi:MAG: A/G-specific adenine glycosylase [Bacteroidaceae bacterium]|nr:A/G-specific adenine glycosylase [Bacteroidaceae bacterium]